MSRTMVHGVSAAPSYPLVSIVTPSLQQGRFIEKTIRSVLAQDYPAVEYLVMDGGSTDETLDVLRAYSRHITFWESGPDRGQANAINKGFARANGAILAWLNADDVLFPDTVSRAVQALLENNAELAYADCLFLDGNGQYLRPFVEAEDYDAFRLRSCSDYIMQPTAFFTRSAYMACGGLDERLHYVFDWDFWCKLAKRRAAVVRYPGYAACAHIHDAAKTRRGSWDRLHEIWLNVWRHCAGIWPTALFALMAGGCRQRLHGRGSRQRIFWTLCWHACRALSLRNILHVLRVPRGIQGIEYPRRLCRKRCSIDLPFFGDGDAELCLRLRAVPESGTREEQFFSVILNGRSVGRQRLPADGAEHCFTAALPVLPGTREFMRRITLELEFAHDVPLPWPQRLLRPRDGRYAARWEGVTLNESARNGATPCDSL